MKEHSYLLQWDPFLVRQKTKYLRFTTQSGWFIEYGEILSFWGLVASNFGNLTNTILSTEIQKPKKMTCKCIFNRYLETLLYCHWNTHLPAFFQDERWLKKKETWAEIRTLNYRNVFLYQCVLKTENVIKINAIILNCLFRICGLNSWMYSFSDFSPLNGARGWEMQVDLGQRLIFPPETETRPGFLVQILPTRIRHRVGSRTRGWGRRAIWAQEAEIHQPSSRSRGLRLDPEVAPSQGEVQGLCS